MIELLLKSYIVIGLPALLVYSMGGGLIQMAGRRMGIHGLSIVLIFPVIYIVLQLIITKLLIKFTRRGKREESRRFD